MTVEKSIDELNKIIERLEDPNTNIDEAVELFERGVNIVKDCNKILTDTAGKITVLKRELDKFSEVKFDDVNT